MNLSPIERIAQSVEEWGDGWRFLFNPDDHGRRARLSRNNADSEKIVIEIEIHQDFNDTYVFTLTRCQTYDGSWQNVSFSVRNPINRKALDYINSQIDGLERL